MTQDLDSRLQPGETVWLEPGLRRVLAPNPSALTGAGTNTYILGQGRVAVIDPGPADAGHLAAILAALGPDEQIEMIICTHAHLDHTAGVPALKARTGAPVVAFGTAADGLNPAYARMPAMGGGEGADHAFAPDRRVVDGETISGTGWAVQAIHTPGHLGNHICLLWGDRLFSGDQAMGWATSVVSPPEGDMTAYMRSMERLIALAPVRLYPGHGAEVLDGPARLSELYTHRLGREAQILAALEEAPGSAAALAARIYKDVHPGLLPAAARNVLAHLLDLENRGIAKALGAHRAEADWLLLE